MKQNYKDLVVWQRAIDLVAIAYETAKSLPRIEMFALADQIRRSAVSVPANIAEGQGRLHSKEFRQFLSVAKGSLSELHTLFVVAQRSGYINAERLAAREAEVPRVAWPMTVLINRLGT